MTIEFVENDCAPGYAGALQSTRHPSLAERFHFWRGMSGRRYAFTRFPLNRPPAYENAISLFVRRRGADVAVLGASNAPSAPVVPLGADEIHVHLVQGEADAMEAALQDLSALVVRRPAAPCVIELRAA
ncbi:MAG: hypothetical protein IT539_17500 [Bradyrhizobiaceae bacterium]|nr:hypothetical protein [Bradyrhizobiaceae bacterium]